MASDDEEPEEEEEEEEEESALLNDVTGVYAPLLQLRKNRNVDALNVIPLPPRITGGLRDQVEKTKHCNCKRSNCLKLYCDCFQCGIHCSNTCNCVSCRNLPGPKYDEERMNALLITLDRNEHAFRPRLLSLGGVAAAEGAMSESGVSGCHCKRSACLKKYCECFQASIYCSASKCKCRNCQNREGNATREALMEKRRKGEQMQAAAAAAVKQHTRLSGSMAMDRILEGKGDDLSGLGGVVHGGVDPFLPPSTFCIPVRTNKGVTYGPLAFGTLANDTPSMESVTLPPRRKGAYATAQQSRFAYPYTELQTHWLKEADLVRGTFRYMNKEWKRRNGLPLSGVKRPGMDDLDRKLEKRAKSLLDEVEPDVERLKAAMQEAEENMIKVLDEKPKKPEKTESVATYPAASPLPTDSSEKPIDPAQVAAIECREELPPGGAEQTVPAVSDVAKRELTILAAQDAAMMSELATIVREKTLELTRERIRRSGVNIDSKK